MADIEMVHYDGHITLILIMEEEVQSGPAHGRGTWW